MRKLTSGVSLERVFFTNKQSTFRITVNLYKIYAILFQIDVCRFICIFRKDNSVLFYKILFYWFESTSQILEKDHNQLTITNEFASQMSTNIVISFQNKPISSKSLSELKA